ncbi:unnamed protein product [Medioppia subpectinata]|uniref:Ig-like domain-containing protein n=1 Tax=Medioppia subpectinata TaxID=1979941 RepID=A0A7R9KBA6_9ACAR|nr:unnamed protein product [Medioppia subpectinata]CAG2100240.1 unnamed protein product [Medioppia subpectinata]
MKALSLNYYSLLLALEVSDGYSTPHNTSKTDSPVVVKGVAGQSASLPCHIDQKACGEVYFLTWTKQERDDRWSRIYIFADNVEKPLRDLSGRARFSLHKSEAQLSINQLKAGDEALYKCDVTYVGGKCPSLTFVRLDIIVRPSKAYIEHKNSQIENGSEIGGSEGDLLTLACVVIGGKPMPSVFWTIIASDGSAKTIEAKNASSYADNMTRLVLTKQLSRSDLKSRYECHVRHEAIKNNSMDSHVMIDLSVGAKSIEIVGPSDHIKEGDVALIQCIAYGSKPETQIVWKNGTHIIDTEVKSEVEPNSDGSTLNTRSYLELRVTRFDHLNAIQCLAINTAMKEAIKQSIELKIQYPPIVVMEPKNGLIVNESADMVNIYCTFSSNPPEIIENDTKWYKDNQILALDDSQHYMTSLSGYPILTIVNPMRNDSGDYFCSVSNDIGIGKPLETLPLNVLFPPTVNLQIYPNPEQGFTIKEGDDVRMICDIIDGNPLNASKVKWMKNGHQLVSELSTAEPSTHKEITWLSVTRTLSGNYTCLAISEAGVSEVSNSIQIDVSYPPSKALIRQFNGIHAVKGHNLSLECIVSDVGKPSTTTEYQWESADGVPFQTKQSILYLTDLKLTNSGNISCAAVNEVGIGPKGIYKVTPLAPPNIIDFLPTTFGINENVFNKSWAQLEAEEPIGISCRVEYRSRDSKVFYSCVSSDNSVGPSVKSRTQFIVEYSPENMRVRPKRVDVIEYDIPPEISCESDSLPPASYRWHSSSTVDKFIGVIADTPVLSLNTSIHRDRAGTYTCIASNRHGENQIDLLINVLYSPENMRVRPKRVDVIEYDIPPEISCESDSLPPASYRWHSSSTVDKFIGVIADTPVLSLNTSIHRDRAGTYTCIASNRHGENQIDLLINVLYPPTCTLYESRTDDDQEIELICAVTAANPNNELTFNWFFNNTSLNETLIERIVKYEGMKSKITIPINDETLFGSWTCAVANSIGQTDPNCTLYVSPPILVSDWEALGDESVILISTIIAAIIITFIVILLVLICLMRRRRHKQESTRVSQTRENPDGSRSPTPSSLSSHLSSNQDVSSKSESVGGRKLPGNTNDPNLEASNREMYENMPFQRKCMQLNGPFIPQYNENIAQITRELRRTQSARYHNCQPFGVEMDDILYADMYDDVKSGRVKDPRIKPPLPPKGGPIDAKPPKRPPKKTKKTI